MPIYIFRSLVAREPGGGGTLHGNENASSLGGLILVGVLLLALQLGLQLGQQALLARSPRLPGSMERRPPPADSKGAQ